MQHHQQHPNLRGVGVPNIIGNAEEMMGNSGSPSMEALNAVVSQPEKEKAADQTMFVPVEPRRTAAQE